MALKESSVLQRYFDRIAPNYQLMNTCMSLGLDRYWRHRLLKSMSIQNEDIVLDIACGTCDVLALLQSRHPDSRILGLDLSYGMLSEAMRAEPTRHLIRGNGVQTPFEDASFDWITIAFGFRNMPSHEEFLNEAFRLLKPGGNLRILELTRPQSPLFGRLNQIYQNTALPLLASLFGRDREAYKYLAASIAAFPDQDTIQKMMVSTGFCHSRYEPLSMGVTTLFAGEKTR